MTAALRPSTPPRVRPHARARRGGFTLLEVMVALAILAAGLMAVSEITAGALRNHVRARNLDVATLLARGRMVAVEEELERKGFGDFDQNDEGTFEDEGHPEVRWKLEVVKPEVELGPDRVLELLLGPGKTLQDVIGAPAPKDGGPQTVTPGADAFTALLQTQLTIIGERVKKGVREVRLTVSWPDGKREESFTIVTHLVVLQPKEPAT